MRKKKNFRKFFHLKSFIIAIVLPIVFIFLGWLIIQYPYYTNIRFLKFFTYSVLLMYPVFVTTGLGMTLKYGLNMPFALSNLGFYISTYVLYFIPTYFLAKSYYQKNNSKERKKLIIRTLIGFGIFMVLSMGYLIKSYYY